MPPLTHRKDLNNLDTIGDIIHHQMLEKVCNQLLHRLKNDRVIYQLNLIAAYDLEWCNSQGWWFTDLFPITKINKPANVLALLLFCA